MRTTDRCSVHAQGACIFSRVHQIMVPHQGDALLGWNLTGEMFGVPVPALGRDHTEESRSETTGKQVVNYGIHSRAQVEENT